MTATLERQLAQVAVQDAEVGEDLDDHRDRTDRQRETGEGAKDQTVASGPAEPGVGERGQATVETRGRPSAPRLISETVRTRARTNETSMVAPATPISRTPQNSGDTAQGLDLTRRRREKPVRCRWRGDEAAEDERARGPDRVASSPVVAGSPIRSARRPRRNATASRMPSWSSRVVGSSSASRRPVPRAGSHGPSAFASASVDRHLRHPTTEQHCRRLRGGGAQIASPFDGDRRRGADDPGGDQQPTADAPGHSRRPREVVEQFARRMPCSSLSVGRPPTPTPCSTTVAESARRLCRCQGVQIYLLHGDEFELAATVGLSPRSSVSYVAAHPLRRDRETMAGRVALDRRIQQVSRRPHRPGLRPQGRAGDRRLPHADRGPADPRRRGRGGDQPVADQGGAVRRTHDRDAADVRRPGRRGRAQRAPGPRPGGAAASSWPARSSSCRR